MATMPCSREERRTVSKAMEKVRETATCVTWWLETKLNEADRDRGLRARTVRPESQPCSFCLLSRSGWEDERAEPLKLPYQESLMAPLRCCVRIMPHRRSRLAQTTQFARGALFVRAHVVFPAISSSANRTEQQRTTPHPANAGWRGLPQRAQPLATHRPLGANSRHIVRDASSSRRPLVSLWPGPRHSTRCRLASFSTLFFRGHGIRMWSHFAASGAIMCLPSMHFFRHHFPNHSVSQACQRSATKVRVINIT